MLRSIYYCYKDISKEEEYENWKKYCNSEGLSIDQYIYNMRRYKRFLLRNGVKDAVVKCHSTGVNVVIVTGDNIITATAITKDCNNLGNDVNLENLDPRLMCCSCNLDWD